MVVNIIFAIIYISNKRKCKLTRPHQDFFSGIHQNLNMTKFCKYAWFLKSKYRRNEKRHGSIVGGKSCEITKKGQISKLTKPIMNLSFFQPVTSSNKVIAD